MIHERSVRKNTLMNANNAAMIALGKSREVWKILLIFQLYFHHSSAKTLFCIDISVSQAIRRGEEECLIYVDVAEKREREITVESGENAKMHALQLILMISEA